jgi:mRNA-degrading endonuclease RelE of RelBE toxin-antitoxin system
LAHHSRHWWGAQGPRRTRGRGKSGGARIIYYIVTRKSVLYLLDA